ncbi:hypothetical protein AJ78_00616 [Emergomyces pasteurianus Ep9510]|uniref:Uncharacterized protein n=1 Tax=Emergomyces pasteurianus Ep9510 TaxID=1447872 RepID=A0A1J9PU73_9EURO|nr:hypothetical protein AJ78_00616 [Emergomyces pasteurianus Ep9510]
MDWVSFVRAEIHSFNSAVPNPSPLDAQKKNPGTNALSDARSARIPCESIWFMGYLHPPREHS